MIGGDLNAAGTYLNARELDNLRLRRDPNFSWVIRDTVKASVARNLAYDRYLLYCYLS